MGPRVMTAKFGGTCQRCRRPFSTGTQIEWSKGTGAMHADASICAQAPPPAPSTPTTVVNLRGIADFLTAARDVGGLKFPKARFLAPGGGELRLSLAGANSSKPGSIQVNVRDVWVGRVEPDGRVVGALQFDDALLTVLQAIAVKPAEAAQAYGALMCQCSFCGLPLADAGSVEVGYGPTCAKKWNLPHTPKGIPPITTQVAS